MSTRALDRFTQNEVLFRDLIDLTNNVPAEHRVVMMRLLVVSLAAFWEVFHEELCLETFSRNPNPTEKAVKAIANAIGKGFNNPDSEKIKRLYDDVLQIPDITTAWWGNPADRTGESPVEFCKIIDDM